MREDGGPSSHGVGALDELTHRRALVRRQPKVGVSKKSCGNHLRHIKAVYMFSAVRPYINRGSRAEFYFMRLRSLGFIFVKSIAIHVRVLPCPAQASHSSSRSRTLQRSFTNRSSEFCTARPPHRGLRSAPPGEFKRSYIVHHANNKVVGRLMHFSASNA